MRKLAFCVSLVLAFACASGAPLAAQTELDAIARRATVRYVDVPRKVLAFYYPWY